MIITGLYNERGIYEIVNLVNNKFYIGYASISFGDRRDSHFACLRNGYHFNKYLQSDFDKYGEENFEFKILEIIKSDDIEYFKEREKYYISFLNAIENGYNMCDGGNTRIRLSREKINQMIDLNRKYNLGKKASDEAKEHMRETRAKNQNRMHGDNNSTILTKEQVYNIKIRLMNGEGVNDIAREYDVSPACISQINVGKNWKSVFVEGWQDYINSNKH